MALANELFDFGVNHLFNPLVKREAAHRHTLRNLLQREGYADLDAVKTEGRDEGRLTEARSALRRVLVRRKLELSPVDSARIDACTDLATLERWHDQAIDAASAEFALQQTRIPR